MTENNNNQAPDNSAQTTPQQEEMVPISQLKDLEDKFNKKIEKLLVKLVKGNNEPAEDKADKKEEKLSRTAELEKQVRELSKNAMERELREKDMSLRNTTESLLKQQGMAEFSDHALAYLVDAKKMIKYNDNGELMITVNNVEYVGDEFASGVSAWANLPEAKLYKPASGVVGTGDKRKVNSNVQQTRSDGPFEVKRTKDGALSKSTKIQLNDFLKSQLINK